jgi:hypothetical protein
VVSFKTFWQMASHKFNDDTWQPAHLYPNDAHLDRVRHFAPNKKSKEVRVEGLGFRHLHRVRHFAPNKKSNRWTRRYDI